MQLQTELSNLSKTITDLPSVIAADFASLRGLTDLNNIDFRPLLEHKFTTGLTFRWPTDSNPEVSSPHFFNPSNLPERATTTEYREEFLLQLLKGYLRELDLGYARPTKKGDVLYYPAPKSNLVTPLKIEALKLKLLETLTEYGAKIIYNDESSQRSYKVLIDTQITETGQNEKMILINHDYTNGLYIQQIIRFVSKLELAAENIKQMVLSSPIADSPKFTDQPIKFKSLTFLHFHTSGYKCERVDCKDSVLLNLPANRGLLDFLERTIAEAGFSNINSSENIAYRLEYYRQLEYDRQVNNEEGSILEYYTQGNNEGSIFPEDSVIMMDAMLNYFKRFEAKFYIHTWDKSSPYGNKFIIILNEDQQNEKIYQLELRGDKTNSCITLFTQHLN